MTPLTDDERWVIRESKLGWMLGYIIASPESGVRHLRDSCSGGMSSGWSHTVSKNRLTVIQREFEPSLTGDCPDDCERASWNHTDTGRHISRWQSGAVIREAFIALPRLQKWSESLPQDTRDRALIAWRTFPENTRDMDELARITRGVVDALGTVPVEATDQGMLW